MSYEYSVTQPVTLPSGGGGLWPATSRNTNTRYWHKMHKHILLLRDHPLLIIHYFQQYHKSTESTLGGGGKSSCMLSKMLVLASVPVCETSLANQHFIVRFWGGGRGYIVKRVLSVRL